MRLSDLYSEAASLTTHALDVARGIPASGLEVELHHLAGDCITLLSRTLTNAQGRCDAPLLTREEVQAGTYMLVFNTAPYHGSASPFGTVVVEFNIADPDGHYHVPLVLAAGGYSTYRGAPPSRLPDDAGYWKPSLPCVSLPIHPSPPLPGVGGAGLTIHAIDLARGIGAASLQGELRRREQKDVWTVVDSFTINDEGRTDRWLVPAGMLIPGDYEISLRAGNYYARAGFGVGVAPFFDCIRIRIRVDDVVAHHHVPLLLSPWGYSCYRGS